MSTETTFIDFILEQTQNAGQMASRKMFGEYALYCNGKVVGLVCDNRLFVKPTKAGAAFIDKIVEAPPYPGAKNYYLMEDAVEDREWMSELIRITAKELPMPKPKKK